MWPKQYYVADTNTINFEWSAIDNATNYDLQFSEDPTFPNGPATTLVGGIGATSSLQTLAPRKTYFWRIRVTGTQPWSYYFTFAIFEPEQCAGLKIWFEANRNVTAPGGQVAEWVDRSPLAIPATQTGSNKPAFISSVTELKQKPVVRFNGTTNPNLLRFPTVTFDGRQGYTCLSVRNYQSNSSSYVQYFMGAPSNEESNGFISESSYYCVGWGAYNTVGGHNGLFASSTSDLTNTYSIYTVQGNVLRRNGIDKLQGVTCRPNEINNTNAKYFFALGLLGLNGGNLAPNLTYKGDLAEVLVYDNDIDSASRWLGEQYLRYKYANPVNLGPDTIFPSFCISATLSAGPGYFTSYLWSTGATSATINVTTVGKYWVEGTDIFGFKSYDTINVRPEIFFNQLPSTAFLCSGDSLVWNTGYPANGFTFNWSNGETTPTLSIKTAGTYSVTIVDNANSSCQLQSTQVAVAVDTFPDYTLGNDTAFCSGNRLNFVYADSISSIVWSTGDITRETEITTPGNYSVQAFNANGCFAEDTIHVSISGIAPAVAFTNDILCTTDTIAFTDLTPEPNGVPLSSWVWDFGDGTTDSTQNPTHVFTSAGSYTVSLTIVTDSGCVNSLTKTLQAYLKPVSNFVSKVSCATAETQFLDLSTTDFPAFIMFRKWNFAGLDTSILNNPAFAFPTQGKYEVTLQITNTPGCVSIAKDSVEVFAEFAADFSFSNLCQGDSVVFKDMTPSYSIVSWLWQTEDEIPTKNYFVTTQDFKFKYKTPGKHPISLQVQNAIGCIDKVTDTVTIYPTPVAGFENGLTCEDRLYTPVDTSIVVEQNNTWKWNIAGSNYTGQAPQHFFADSGLYPISLLITSQNGCKDSTSGFVRVSPNPVADFTFTPLYGEAPLEATFSNESQYATSYIWNFGDGVTDNVPEPTHTYTTNDTFDIKLVAVNSAGCSDSITKSIVATITELDIAVDRVYAVKTPLNDGTVLVSVTADLSNQGTRLITTSRLYATIGSGGVMSETWDSLFEAGHQGRYTFKANFVVAASSANTYVCVEATSVNNGETETTLENNGACTSLTDVIQLIGPSPNPARGEATLGLILPKAGKVTIEIINVVGQPVQDMVELDLPEGRTDFSLPVKILRAAEYFIRIKHNDDKLIRKLVVH